MLKDNKIKSANGLVIPQSNMNSLRNKFEQLSFTVNGNFDIFMVSETMLDEMFSTTMLSWEGFCKPYRFDRNRNGGGDIILYVRYDVPSRVIKKFQDNIEYFFVQTNLRQKKISAS